MRSFVTAAERHFPYSSREDNFIPAGGNGHNPPGQNPPRMIEHYCRQCW